MNTLWKQIINCGVHPDDSPETVLNKQMVTLLPIIIGAAAAIWGSIYIYLGHPFSAAIPLSYSVISLLTLIHFNFSKNLEFVRFSQLVLVMFLPFFLMWSLGGFWGGSYVMIWAFFAPLSVMSFSIRGSYRWFAIFLALTIVSFLIDNILRNLISPLPDFAINVFSLLNITAGFGGIFYIMTHYVKERDKIALQHRNYELQLQEAVIKAEHAARVKSDFLANMSHEIRTPMNSVIGMTDLALASNLNETQKNYVSKANLAAKNLLGIINDILDFSKMEAGKLELSNSHFELRKIITNTIHLISAAAKEKGIKIKVKITKDVPDIYFADDLRLSQILINLINNAVKFNQISGTITLSVSVLEDNFSDALLQFSIEDEGIGISQENQAKLFQSFTQAESSTSRTFGGTGLGLAISQKIVQQMGGRIWVESKESEGSIFFFTVRLGKSDKNAIIDSTNDMQTAMALSIEKLQGANILLVEDNAMNQELAEDLLKRNGLNIIIANNGLEALDILEKQSFDGILMDCQMPIMDGYEATRRIRENNKYQELPILAMTANAMESDRQKAIQSGMNDHIAKPIIPAEMFITMAKWIKK